MHTDIAKGDAFVAAEVRGEGEAVVELLEGGIGYDTAKPSRKVLASATADKGEAVVHIDAPELWTPDHPYLYGLRITLVKDGKTIDKVEGYTAFREISAVRDADGHKRMALNGEPLFQYGPLDQGWWPDGLYTAPCDEALRYDIERTKEYAWLQQHAHEYGFILRYTAEKQPITGIIPEPWHWRYVGVEYAEKIKNSGFSSRIPILKSQKDF